MSTPNTASHNEPAKSSLKRWLWLLFACLLITAVLGGLKFLQISKAIAFGNSFPERSESVTAVVAATSQINKTYRTLGDVQASRYVELRNEVDGKIVTVNFSGGDRVNEGQVLLQLDSREERAQLRATRAQLTLAKLQLQRSLELRKKNLASKNDVDIAKADKDVLVANAAALVASIDKKTLKTPFNAETSVHNLQVGQYLAANSIVTELSGGEGQYWLDFKLPQEYASLSVGDLVQVSGRNLITGNLAAKIVRAESRINETSRTRGYRAAIDSTSDQVAASLRPGAVLNIDIVVSANNTVFRLPASAVRRSNFGAFVYVLNTAEENADADYRAERRQVAVDGAEDSDVFVISGLQVGEKIAAIGAFKLEDGMLANIVTRKRVTESESAP